MAAPLNVAFIGAGGIAARHVGVMEHIPDARMIAFTDIARPRAEELAGRVGANVYTDFREMLDKEKPDAVYVVFPPFAHGEVEHELAQRKIPFFVEKPLSTKIEVAEGIAAAVEAAGIVTGVGYHWRYFDTIAGVKNSLQHHTPRMALGYWLDSTPPPSWWWHRDQSGGQMVEQTTHIFDLARYLMGEVEEVYAATSFTRRERWPESDVDDVSLATLKFKSGAIANMASTCILNSKYHAGLTIFTEGEAYECFEHRVTIDRGHGNREDWHPHVDPVWEEDNAFFQAVRANDPTAPRVPYAEALKTHRLVLRAVQSAQEGKPLVVSN